MVILTTDKEAMENQIDEILMKISPESLEHDLEALIKYFDDQARKYSSKHKLSRRLSLLCFFLALFSMTHLVLTKLTGLRVEGAILTASHYWSLWGTLLTITAGLLAMDLSMYKDTLKIFAYTSFMLFLTTLIFYLFPYPSMDMYFLTMATLGFSVSTILYLSNRLFGFTRAWSRNKTVSEKLNLLKSKLLYMRCNQENTAVLKSIDDQTSSELFDLIEAELDEKHLDLMKDYIFFGNTILRTKVPKIKE